MRQLNALVSVAVGLLCGAAAAVIVALLFPAVNEADTGTVLSVLTAAALGGGVAGGVVAYLFWQKWGNKDRPPVV